MMDLLISFIHGTRPIALKHLKFSHTLLILNTSPQYPCTPAHFTSPCASGIKSMFTRIASTPVSPSFRSAVETDFSFIQSGVKAEEWPHYLKEVYRILKPGGWAQISEPDIVPISDTNTLPHDAPPAKVRGPSLTPYPLPLSSLFYRVFCFHSEKNRLGFCLP